MVKKRCRSRRVVGTECKWSGSVGDVSEADGGLIGRSGSSGHQSVVYSHREAEYMRKWAGDVASGDLLVNGDLRSEKW